LSAAVPCSRDPYTGGPTPHLHAGGCTLAEAGLKEGNEREGLQLPQTPLQLHGESLSLVIQTIMTLGQALPIIRHKKIQPHTLLRKAASPDLLIYHIALTAFKMFFISASVIFLPLHMVLLAKPLFKAH